MLSISTYTQNPRLLALAILKKTWWLFTDKRFLQLRYYLEMHRKLNLDNPQTFTEKIQWLKLYNRKPEYTTLVDKYAVKDYVAKKIGHDFIIPTLGIWKSFDDINFDSLPQSFVLKTTHGGGSTGIVICKNKASFDYDKAKKILTQSLKNSIYTAYKEWSYKHVPRQIIAEKFIPTPSNSDLTDYKFYCFNGVPHYCQVISNRSTKETIDFFDMEWNHMPFYGLNPLKKPALSPLAKPIAFEQMKGIAQRLSERLAFARIDLYAVDNTAYFGEITLYPASGFGIFTPEEWDLKLGTLLTLPSPTL